MYLGAPTNAYYLPTIAIDTGTATISLAVQAGFLHAAHAVHGSVYFKLLDDAAFFAVQSEVIEVFVLTASFSLHLLRPVTQGTLTATGSLVHRTRRQFIADAVLHNDAGELVARGTGTFMRSAIRLGPEVGYALRGTA